MSTVAGERVRAKPGRVLFVLDGWVDPEVLAEALTCAGLRVQDVDCITYKENPGSNPRPLIVAMGAKSANVLVWPWPGENDAMVRRGYFWPQRNGSPVMTTFLPTDSTFRTMPNKMLMQIDMARVREFLLGKLPYVDVPKARIARHPNDALLLFKQECVAFDIETTWGGTGLLCVGFYGNEMEYPLVFLRQNFDWCIPFLESDVPKVAHNGQFDTYFLKYKMPERQRVDIHLDHDTSVLHWAQYLELAGKQETGGEGAKTLKSGMTRKSLIFLASQHLNVRWWKYYTKDIQRMAELCGQDVFVTRKLLDIMMKDAEDEGVIPQYHDAMSRIPVLNTMQSRGLRVNNILRKNRVKALKKRQEQLQKESHAAAIAYIKANEVERFAVVKQCKCCGGGVKVREQCWRCAGFEKKPTKKMYLEYYPAVDPKLAKAQFDEILEPCNVCAGLGSITTYEFNPMSPKQMGDLLYNELEVPRSTLVKPAEIKADEDTIKRVLEWSSR